MSDGQRGNNSNTELGLFYGKIGCLCPMHKVAPIFGHGSAFHISARPRSRSSSALVLPGLPNMGKSTSAFNLCRDFQRCEVPLPHFCSAFTAKDLKFRFPYFCSARTSKYLVHLPHLFCQDFQIWVSPLPHFISARTSKEVKFRFRTSALP